VGYEVRIGPGRLVALVAPGLVRRPGLTLLIEVQRAGAGFVAKNLALQVRGNGKDFQTVLLGEAEAFFRIPFRTGVAVALAEVQLPARLLPAVEAGVGEELDPLLHVHVAELAADQADLVVRPLTETMTLGLLESHDAPFLCCEVLCCN